MAEHARSRSSRFRGAVPCSRREGRTTVAPTSPGRRYSTSESPPSRRKRQSSFSPVMFAARPEGVKAAPHTIVASALAPGGWDDASAAVVRVTVVAGCAVGGQPG